MEKFRHEEDIEIIRNHPLHVGMAIMMDCDGDIFLVVPESWTDPQILTAFRFGNRLYGLGHQHGQKAKTDEMKKVLEIV